MNKTGMVLEALAYLNTSQTLAAEQDVLKLVNFRAPGAVNLLEVRQNLNQLVAMNKVDAFIPLTQACGGCGTSGGCCSNGACGGGCCGCGRYYRVKIGAM